MSLVERFVVGVDMQRFSSRVTRQQVVLQRELDRMLEEAAEGAGICRKLWKRRAEGDGEVAVLPADVDLLAVVRRFVSELDLRLTDHNEDHSPETHIRLRVAMHMDVITPGALGYAGPAFVVLQRLLDSAPVRTALMEAPEANLAQIISEPLYQKAVVPELGGLRPRQFQTVRVDLPGKDFHQTAHVYVPREWSAPSIDQPPNPAKSPAHPPGFPLPISTARTMRRRDQRSADVPRGIAEDLSHPTAEPPALSPAVRELVRRIWGSLEEHDIELLDTQLHRLAEQRIGIVEDRIDLDLALGVEPDSVGQLLQLVTDHPLRDQLTALLMLAPHRSGRRAEALTFFHEVCRHLRDELGIDPSASLQTLHQQIVTGDSDLDLRQANRVTAAAPAAIDFGWGRAGPDTDRGQATPRPPRIDVTVPHPTRVHDYWLGGRHNFAADRELAEEIMKIMPGIEEVARLNQSFLRRAALFMVESGIRQFIDIGSGIPTVGHLHEIIQRADPECRIVYVDHDPVAVAHSALLFESIRGTAVIQTDLRDVTGVLDAETTRSLLDLAQPIGLIAPMLHFLPDSWNPAAIIASYRDRLASGSYLALAHVTADTQTPGLAETVKAYQRTRYHVYPRSYAQIMHICAGFDLVSPGLVGYALWRPEGLGDVSANTAINSVLYAAVGRKPDLPPQQD